MDGITHCKIKRNKQLRLLEFFVLEVTARTAADFLGIQPNTAILFYKKIRLVIAYYLALEEKEMFDEKIELDESYFVVIAREKEDVERLARWLFLAFSREKERFIR